jgi:CheY-like chemotaxis protein
MTNQTVLIVDDSRLARMMIRAFIEAKHKDWTIIEAADSQEALEKSSGQQCDVISIDYNMPGMNGLELATLMKERFPSAKIAIFTANAQDSIRNQAVAQGLEFIVKPITEDKVAGFISL